MGILESREALQSAIDSGVNEKGEPYGTRQLEHLKTVLAMSEFDSMSIEQRRKAYDNLMRGFQPVRSTAPAAASAPSDPSSILGWVLFVAGFTITIVSLVMTTSVTSTTGSDFVGDTYIPATTTTVKNLGLLQNQMMVFDTGLAIAICGVVLICAGAVRGAIRVWGGPSPLPQQTPDQIAPSPPVAEDPDTPRRVKPFV